MKRISIAQGTAPGPLLSARNIAALLIVVMIVAGGVLRARAIGGNTRVSADEYGYVDNANRMLAGRRYATFKWPPVTSIAFAVATKLAGHDSLRAAAHAHGPAQDTQLAIGLLTLIAIAMAAWAAAGPWAALVATALTATYIPLVLATRTFLSEPAGGLVLLAAVGATVFAHSRLRARERLGASAESHALQSGPDATSRAHAWLLSRREFTALALAGAIGGVACLTRGDLLVGMGMLALALGLAGRPGWRTGLLRGSIYLAALALVLAPWLAYASAIEGRFVPITTAGPDALFVGTYLPGNGLLVPTEEALAPQVCRHFPQDCGRYWQLSSAPLFRLIQTRYPHVSEATAATQASLENLRHYALGRPVAFATMLWRKFWSMWDNAWSGGNSGLHPDTSRTQHLIYLTIAWLGLIAGIALTRRFMLIVSVLVLLSVAALATLFNDQARYNVSLMPLLFLMGAVGAALAAQQLMARRGRLTQIGAAIAHD